MIAAAAFFILAFLAECMALLAFSYGFVRGACVAAYEKGFTKGYGEEETQVVEDED